MTKLLSTPRSKPRPRWFLALGLLGALGSSSCAAFDELLGKEPEKQAVPIGCPGESIGSAKKVTECVCSKGRVLKAGALECSACDTSVSGGAFCSCTDQLAIFSFDGRLERPLGLDSDQVVCAERSECEPGTRADDSGECVPCGKDECGPSCGVCPVGATCISGVCSDAAACVVTEAFPQFEGSECSLGSGDIAGYAKLGQLFPDMPCTATDLKDTTCSYDGYGIPLSTPGETRCPGQSSFDEEEGACVCGEGKVLRSSGLECESCEPRASRNAYCDCGKNEVFSFNGLLEIVYQLVSETVSCEEPSNCEKGARADHLTGECLPCGEGECGPTCGACSVGETCISGRCIFGSACRVTRVTKTDPAAPPCHFQEGEVAYVDFVDNMPLGTSCGFDERGCSYEALVEALSK